MSPVPAGRRRPQVPLRSHDCDVALIISHLGLGGTQRVLLTMAGAFIDRGYSVCVVTLDGPETDFYELPPHAERVSIGSRSSTGDPLRALVGNLLRVVRLRGALRSLDPTVAVSFLTATNVLTVLASIGNRPRVVLAERNDPQRQPLRRPWGLLRRLLYRRADVVTANSESALEWMRDFVPADRLAHIPNPVPAPPPLPPPESRQDVLLGVGRLTAQKGFDVLIRAFAAASRDLEGWSVVILGEGGSRRALEDLIDELGLSECVTIAGLVDDPADWYRRAKVFVLPSRFEGTPNALLEAMAYGLAPIVTDVPSGALNYVTQGVSGLVVPVEDDRALGRAIRRLAGDDELRERLGIGARMRIESEARRDVTSLWERTIGLHP